MRNKNISYGKYIKIKGKNMYTSVSGNGERVVLLLPGLGSVCPIIEMKALTTYLQDKYTVVTIEYLGYGMSDNSSQERTIENIVDDIHTAMNTLGFTRYAIVGHSIAGLYCLMYTNKYPNEVTHFVGIDISVPQQINMVKSELEKMLEQRLKVMESRLFFLPCLAKTSAKRFLKHSSSYKYSKSELHAYGSMAAKALYEGSVVNELQNAEYNFSVMQDVKFPEPVPVLLLVASESNKSYCDWFKWHNELLNSTGVIEMIEGTHILHLEKPKLVAEKVDKFIMDTL